MDKPKGRIFVVECIGNPRTDFGDSLDSKCKGSIAEKASIIIPENGFINIGYSQNPMDYIERLEKKDLRQGMAQ